MKSKKILILNFMFIVLFSSTSLAEKDITMEQFLSDDSLEISAESFDTSSDQTAILINNETGAKAQVKLHEKKRNEDKEVQLTSDLLSSYSSERIKVKEYAVIVNDENIIKDKSGSRSFNEASSNVQWDRTGGIKGWIQVFYKIKLNSRGEESHYLLTGVRGDWKVADSSYTIANQRVRYICSSEDVSQEKSHPVSWPFNINSGFTEYVENKSIDIELMVAARSYTEIRKKDSGSWGLIVPRLIAYNQISW